MKAVAGRGVSPLLDDGLQERGIVPRVMLQVSVLNDHDVAGGVLDPGADRGATGVGYGRPAPFVTMTQSAIEALVARARRLYEQEPGGADSRLDEYARRWRTCRRGIRP